MGAAHSTFDLEGPEWMCVGDRALMHFPRQADGKQDTMLEKWRHTSGIIPVLQTSNMTTKQLLTIRHEMAKRCSLTAADAAERSHVLDDLMEVQSILPTILFEPVEALEIIRGDLTSTASEVLESEPIFHSLQRPTISCAEAARITRLAKTISKGCPVRAVVREEQYTSASKQPFALLMVQRTERLSDNFTVMDFVLLCECGPSTRLPTESGRLSAE